MEQFLVFLQKNPLHLVLFGTAVITGGMLLWPLINRVSRPGNEVGVTDAVQLINRRDAVVLDVRENDEYAGGHIANSRHIPLAQLGGRIKELEKFRTRPVIICCRSGSRAAAAIDVLRKNGFNEAVMLRGGISAWQQAGMPLEKK
ncbi:MAG: rhodanese-like domain-containing protein [Burkholderiales bacterium]